MPYHGEMLCNELKKELNKITSQHFPQINIRTIFYNNFKIRNFFQHKDKTPALWCSDIVYKYKCAVCGNCYLGSSNRSLAIRASEHAGRSYRTQKILAKPTQSAVREHSEYNCNKQVSLDEFTILYKGSYLNEIRIAESLLIKSTKPTLNNDVSSFPLKLF